MIIQIGTDVDESRILWKYKESDEWKRADIDDLIRAYEKCNTPAADTDGDLISRQDAIDAVAQQWLFEASAESPYVNDDDIGDYRKLASELLSDIPSADRPIVDKEYLIDLIQEAVYDGEACSKLMDLVDRPSVEWIPVSERLPEDGQPVIITTDDKAFKDHQVGSCIYQNGRFQTNYQYDIKMIAWMPLPEPYKGGE